jgi:glycosyltransferase involved in cell wall biosynthesis
LIGRLGPESVAMPQQTTPIHLDRGDADHIEARSAPAPVPHLVHVFPRFNTGGAQVRFATLVEGLGARFRHTVISLSGDYAAATLIAPGATVRYVQPPARSGSLISRLGAYRAQLAALKPDLLLTYNWGAIEVALANAVAGAPHLHLEDGFGPEEAQRQFLRRVWTRRAVLARSQVVVPSLTLWTVAAKTWGLARRNIHYIPNGVPPRHVQGTATLALELDLPADRPRIAWVGALRPEKNPTRLLRAFAPLKDQAVLLLIGDGPERAAVLQEAERLELGRSLRLLGHRPDARDLVMQCQVLAISSDTEQMPLVVLEAMDAALPIASFDVGDIRRMVAPENRPFVVPPSDMALAAALQSLLADPSLRAKVGQANRARLRCGYSSGAMIEAHGALYDRMSRRSFAGGRAHG